ncbi:MAG: hypothetical protein AAF492_01440 [Verrucomicrobiota bacterium]
MNHTRRKLEAEEAEKIETYICSCSPPHVHLHIRGGCLRMDLKEFYQLAEAVYAGVCKLKVAGHSPTGEMNN